MRKISEKVQIIHGQFVKYGRNAREWMRKCEMLLPQIKRSRVWEKKGFSSIYEYAAKLAGMSRGKVDVVLWTMKKIEDKEEILKVVGQKGVNAVKPIANIVTPENQSFWAEKASEMSVHTLETYAKEYKKNQLMDVAIPKVDSFHVERKKVVGMELDVKVLEELEKLKGAGEWNALMKNLLEMRRLKLEQEKPEKVKVVKAENHKGPVEGMKGEHPKKVYRSRKIPQKIQKFVKQKTNGRCAFPGCNMSGKILHHTERFALKKEHNPDTIALLCVQHERLVHTGLIEEVNEPREWRIKEFANEMDKKWHVDKLVQEYRKTVKAIGPPAI